MERGTSRNFSNCLKHSSRKGHKQWVTVGGGKSSAVSGHLSAGSIHVQANHSLQVLIYHLSERGLRISVCALGVHLGCVCVCVCAFMCVQSCLTLCNLVGCNLPGSSVHGMSQARILEWVAISSSRERTQFFRAV